MVLLPFDVGLLFCLYAECCSFLQHFENTYRGFKQSSKWKLPSGLYVEDCLYENFRNLSEECAAHSWIINVKDEPRVKKCFSDEDWSDVVASVARLPAGDEGVMNLIARYGKV